MKTLVVGTNGTWLAQELGCTLLAEAGEGLVTKVAEVQPVWDRVVNFDPLRQFDTASQRVLGWSLLGDRIYHDPEYALAMLTGQQLQPLEQGVEGLSCGLMAWWSGGWEGKPVLVIEQLGFMNRDLGYQCRMPQGVTLTPVEPKGALGEVLQKVEPLLTDYEGPVCFRLSVSGKRVYVKYLRLGFVEGWSETALELQRGNWLTEPMNLMGNIAVGVGVSVPNGEWQEIQLEPGAAKHLRSHNLAKENEQLVCKDFVGYATAWGRAEAEGNSAREARMRIYRSLRNVRTADVQYRTDISTTFDGVLEQLQLLRLV